MKELIQGLGVTDVVSMNMISTSLTYHSS